MAYMSMNSPGYCLLLQPNDVKEAKVPFELSPAILSPKKPLRDASLTESPMPASLYTSHGQPGTCCHC